MSSRSRVEPCELLKVEREQYNVILKTLMSDELQEKVQHMLESPFLTKDALAWIANVFDYDFQDFRKTAPRVIKVFGL